MLIKRFPLLLCGKDWREGENPEEKRAIVESVDDAKSSGKSK